MLIETAPGSARLRQAQPGSARSMISKLRPYPFSATTLWPLIGAVGIGASPYFKGSVDAEP